MKNLVTLLSVLAMSTSIVVAAEGEKKAQMTTEERFKKLDTNTDGKISMEEFNNSPMSKKDPTKAAERFGKMDKDGDKSLNMEEFTPKKKKQQ